MTDKKNPQTESVDWAERLKASMNESPAETKSPAPSVDDDLAALLRAQLAHREQAVAAFELDTSEFEEEADDFFGPDDFADSEGRDEGEDEYNEYEEDSEAEDFAAEEDEDDLPWDDGDEDDLPDEIPEPETRTVFVAEDEPTEEDEDDLPWEDEDEDDLPDEIPEPETRTVFVAEDEPAEDEDDLPWEDEDEDDLPDEFFTPEPVLMPVYIPEEPDEPAWEEPVVIPTRGFTIEPVPYEESEEPDEKPYTPYVEELISPDGVVGDIRLLAAEEESNRLLEEMYAEASSATPDEEEEDTSEEAPTPTPAVAEPAPVARKAEQAPRPAPHDPLQLGLDDILPKAEPLPAAESRARKTEAPVAAPAANYTARMARPARDREETVRDAELYLRLGYEEQMTRSEQQEAVEEARRRARERKETRSRNETPPVKAKREFTNRDQTPAIERAYARSRRLALTRLLVAVVGALFGILYDLYGVLSASLSVVTFTDSFLYPLLGVMWTAAVCLPFLGRLGRGLGSLFEFEPTRYAVSALALLTAIGHGMLSVVFGASCLFGGVALFMLAIASATEYMTAAAEQSAFSVASAGKTSFLLTDETTPASAAHAERAPSERTLTAVRADRVSDFFARTGRYNPYMGRLNYLLPMALLASIACAGVAIMQGGTLLAHGLPVFVATYLSCLPAAYLVSMSLPLLASNRLLRRKGAAVLGTAAPAELCKKGSTRLLIRDGDAVGRLNRKEITLRDDPKADLWRRKASYLFRLLECPLWKESPLGDDLAEGLCVEVAETEEGYVRLFLIDLEGGETNEVMMGTRESLTRRGVRLPKASMEQIYKKTEESRVVYLAFDGTFRIAYAVEYRPGYTFAEAVRALATMGDTAALVTYDPLVGDELLQVERLKDAPKVEILRPTYVESVRKTCSSGVIATGRSLDLLYPYTACRRMKRVYRLSHLVGWLTILAATALSLGAVLTGHSALLSSSAVTAWQILLAVASAVISLSGITRKSLFLPYDLKKPYGETKSPSVKADTKKDKDQ